MASVGSASVSPGSLAYTYLELVLKMLSNWLAVLHCTNLALLMKIHLKVLWQNYIITQYSYYHRTLPSCTNKCFVKGGKRCKRFQFMPMAHILVRLPLVWPLGKEWNRLDNELVLRLLCSCVQTVTLLNDIHILQYKTIDSLRLSSWPSLRTYSEYQHPISKALSQTSALTRTAPRLPHIKSPTSQRVHTECLGARLHHQAEDLS